jgi:RND family efflux transporter MFP subunit
MMKIQFIMTRQSNYILPVRLFIGCFLIGSLLACNENQEKVSIKNQEIGKADTLKVFLLTADSAQKTISLPGELLPNENAQIRAKVQGYIRKLNVDIGSHVKKGQILALIDAPEINTRVQELNEKVSAARSRYESSKDYFDRINEASKADGVVAPSELQRTKNQMLADSSEYNATVFAASSYRQIGGYLAIIAPYNGIITKRTINVGSFVGNPNEQPLFELQDNSLLRLQVPVPEVYTGAVLLNNAAEVTTRSQPDKKFKATLVRASGSIDNQSRSELWEFAIPNTSGELKAGSYTDVKLRFLRSKPSMLVPTSAVVTTLEKKFVIRVSNNTTQWIDVRPGFNMGEKQEVFGDLKPGDTLVLKGNEELKAGITVITKIDKK